jgi:hypothetical protein
MLRSTPAVRFVLAAGTAVALAATQAFSAAATTNHNPTLLPATSVTVHEIQPDTVRSG